MKSPVVAQDPTAEDRRRLAAVFGGLVGDHDPLPLFEAVGVFEFEVGATVPAIGLCVVLRGRVRVELAGAVLAEIPAGAWFFEEQLLADHVGRHPTAVAQEPLRLAVLARPEWETLELGLRDRLGSALLGDLLTTRMHEFQQPINCCNITALALGLSALGFPTDVNAVFKRCRLPAAYVVDDGLALSEIYDVACVYIHAHGLGQLVSVECHHFDEGATSEQDLITALNASLLHGGQDDVIIANFSVALAHANPGHRGGHFALIGQHNPVTGIVHMVDVNPEKYGRVWLTNTRRLHAALIDRDGTSYRGRGLIRLATRDAHATTLDSLARPCRAVDPTRRIRARNNDYVALFQRPATNLDSLAALALSLRALGIAEVDADDLMWAGNVSYPDVLTYIPTPRELGRIAQTYLSRLGGRPITTSVRTYGESANRRLDPGVWLRSQLAELNDPARIQMIVQVDLNRMLGCSAIRPPSSEYRRTSHRQDFWIVCTHLDPITEMVTVADGSPATSHMWEAPFEHVLRGLDNGLDPAVVVLQREPDARDLQLHDVIEASPLVLFKTDDDPWSYTVQTILSNIGVTALELVDVGGYGVGAIRLRQQLVADSGRDRVPYLYLDGQCLGDTDAILAMVESGELQRRLGAAGIHVLERHATPSLAKNVYGYPKGGLLAAPDARRNVLVCACGSSAADKVPELIERLIEAGHDVKLAPSASAEHFYRDFGMTRILAKLAPSDIYRDDDEWNFRYIEFGMPVRACHLALCDWADCIVVAPVTCNTMAKIAHGVADNLLSSIFVAWQYSSKPVIMAPACNTNMWNNLITQQNVGLLRSLGVRFAGPLTGLLSNGAKGIGMMASPEQIVAAVEQALIEVRDPTVRVIEWGRQAAAADDAREWAKIYRCIDDGVVAIDVRDPATGDSLLHFAAGGEGEVNERGIVRGVPDLHAARELLARGIAVDSRNCHGFAPLDVAIMNRSLVMAEMLVAAGADPIATLERLGSFDLEPELREALIRQRA